MLNLFHNKTEENKNFISVGKKKGFWQKREERLARQIAKELVKWIELEKGETGIRGSGKVKVIKPYDLELDKKMRLEDKEREEALPHPIKK